VGLVYSDKLTLAHIFNNRSLAKKLPLGDYKEQPNRKGKIDNKAQMRVIANQVKDIARQAATPYYKPLKTTRSNRTIVISGKLVKSYDTAFNGIFKAIDGKKRLLASIAVNNETIRYASMEDKARSYLFGDSKAQTRQLKSQSPKLYLRAKSTAEIKKMNANQLWGVMNDIMDSIKYSGNYPATVKELGINTSTEQFRREQLNWQKKVGLI